MTGERFPWEQTGAPHVLSLSHGAGAKQEIIMSADTSVPKGQPEALATFAAAALNGGKKPENIGLMATNETAAIPTDTDDKADAATKVLREGVLGTDQGAEEAIDRLPDRISGQK
jgi:hypothetical protein